MASSSAPSANQVGEKKNQSTALAVAINNEGSIRFPVCFQENKGDNRQTSTTSVSPAAETPDEILPLGRFGGKPSRTTVAKRVTIKSPALPSRRHQPPRMKQRAMQRQRQQQQQMQMQQMQMQQRQNLPNTLYPIPNPSVKGREPLKMRLQVVPGTATFNGAKVYRVVSGPKDVVAATAGAKGKVNSGLNTKNGAGCKNAGSETEFSSSEDACDSKCDCSSNTESNHDTTTSSSSGSGSDDEDDQGSNRQTTSQPARMVKTK